MGSSERGWRPRWFEHAVLGQSVDNPAEGAGAVLHLGAKNAVRGRLYTLEQVKGYEIVWLSSRLDIVFILPHSPKPSTCGQSLGFLPAVWGLHPPWRKSNEGDKHLLIFLSKHWDVSAGPGRTGVLTWQTSAWASLNHCFSVSCSAPSGSLPSGWFPMSSACWPPSLSTATLGENTRGGRSMTVKEGRESSGSLIGQEPRDNFQVSDWPKWWILTEGTLRMFLLIKRLMWDRMIKGGASDGREWYCTIRL